MQFGVQNLTIIGRREWVCLPDIGVSPLLAKIDTGAYRSSLHGEILTFSTNELGIKFVHFLPFSVSGEKATPLVLPLSYYKNVKSSNAVSENRPVVKLMLKIGTFSFYTDFTITNRGKMKFPILLGRKCLRKKFLVDVSKSCILLKPDLL